MEEYFEECVYKYGENYYTIKEIYNLYNNGNYSDKKEIKDCICNYILAEIIKKGGFEKEAKDLDTLTTYRVEHIGKTMNKSEKVLYKKSIALKGLKLLGPVAIKNSYKLNEITNGEWILKRLVKSSLFK